MRVKTGIIGAVLAIMCVVMSNDANAYRHGCRGGYRYGGGYPRAQVWVAPPVPRIVVAGPGYGYGDGYGYGYRRAPRYRAARYGYYRQPRYSYGYSYNSPSCGRYGRRW